MAGIWRNLFNNNLTSSFNNMQCALSSGRSYFLKTLFVNSQLLLNIWITGKTVFIMCK